MSIFTEQRRAEIVSAADSKAYRVQDHWIDGAFGMLTREEADAFAKAFGRTQGTGKRMAELLREILLGAK